MSGPRRWLELRARRPSAEEDTELLAEGLLALGGRAVEERDGWCLTHLEEPEDLPAFLARARTVLAEGAGEGEVELAYRWQPHEDWAESWKKGLDTRHVTERLVVTPSWIPYEARAGERVLVLDPGMAFGTAEHGTTRGCLRLLDRVVEPGDRVLDVGAGSGILAIAAVLLGAREVVALEGDPLACEAMRENLERNGVADRVRVLERWAEADRLGALGPRDGVVANIEWRLLRPLVPGLAGALEPGGWLLLSGILAEEMAQLREETGTLGWAEVRMDADGAWRSVLLRRNEPGRAGGGVSREER